MVTPGRQRSVLLVLLLVTIALGLASRHFSHHLPWWLAKNAGDVLYATMIFWLVLLLCPRLASFTAAVAAFGFCVAIEFAKFLQFPWLVSARQQVWGRLIFGVGFHVSNLVCYAIGVGLGMVICKRISA